jgi:N-acetylmuramoyl-L-alanine amidase
MADIKYITVHCSATQPKTYVDVKVIERMHRERGFLKVGYHFVIKRDGTVETGRSVEETGAHVEGHNKGNLGICLAGGVDAALKPEANYTDEQYVALAQLLIKLKKDYPDAEILGHRDWPNVKKACPCFDVRQWIKDTGVFV